MCVCEFVCEYENESRRAAAAAAKVDAAAAAACLWVSCRFVPFHSVPFRIVLCYVLFK